MDSKRKLMMLEYDRKISELEEKNENLRNLNENFETILEKERMRYVF